MSREPHIKKPRPGRQWPIRLTFSSFGLLLIALGVGLFRRGILWYTAREAGYGARITMPTLGLATVGMVFLILGLIPWPKDPGSRKSDRKWKTHV